MNYETLLEQIKAVSAWNSLKQTLTRDLLRLQSLQYKRNAINNELSPRVLFMSIVGKTATK